MKAAPKRRFRIHRRGRAAFVGREPLLAVAAWLAANLERFRAGTVAEVIVEHDPDCRYPAGKPCTCRNGPEIHIRGERPSED